MYAIPNTHRGLTLNSNTEKVSDDHIINTTLVLNRTLSLSELEQIREDVHAYGQYHELITKDIDTYHIQISGSAKKHMRAFKVNMVNVKTERGVHHESTQSISIPASWKDKVEHILGYDTRPIAKPYYHKLGLAQRGDIGSYFYPTTLARLYNFPANLDGTGQKIGIIELGGGFVLSDIVTYFSRLGITGTPNVTAVGVDGANNNPLDTSGANLEVILDIEVIAAVAPKAAIYVYFAPNSDQGFYDAINTAMNNGCSIISISWGAAESFWSSSSLNTYNNLFQTASTRNVTIFAAAGDNGSSDGSSGSNVDFPASSPYVCGCGGTSLISSNNTTISTETVWNNNSSSSATGGGISTYFAKPSYQSSVSYALGNKRGVPDVAGNANPNTGYILYSLSEGGWITVGGTSAVAPLWAGLFGRINQSLGRAAGFIQPTLYANSSAFRDIIQGNNGAYTAGVGWDPSTGNGTPNGQSILSLFSGSQPSQNPVANFTGTPTTGIMPLTVNFTDQSTNTPTSWSWNFGNNTTSTSQNPSCTYNTAGTYSVSLTATNTSGSGTVTKNNYIIVNTNVVTSAFVGTPTTGTAPLTVNFTDQSTGAVNSWSWSFGDNTTSNVRNPSKIYNSPGTYTVSLTVGNGVTTNTLTKNNYITVTQSTVTAAFTGTPVSGNAPLTVSFTDQSTGSPAVSSWNWNFGDNTTSTSRNPSHTYSNPGTYTVSLTAGNGTSTNAITKTNYITARTVSTGANFSATPTSGRATLRVSFTDLTPNATQWLWNFGDGGSSTLRNPVRFYSRSGTYTVSLRVTNSLGTTTVTKPAYIRVT